MERALETLRVPHSFLVFPGEGYGLQKSPWHGYIKVRKELKWPEKYDGKQAISAAGFAPHDSRSRRASSSILLLRNP
jgi:hypothetical protein